MKRILLLVAVCAYCINSYAYTDPELPPKKSYTTAKATQAPTIDGKLNDSAWDAVEWGGDFIQHEPAQGEAPTAQTAFKVLYDDKDLYIGIRAFDDEPEKIVRRMS